MSLDSYDNLKTEIADYLDRDDLTSNIPTFITLCETRLNRRLRIRGMIARGQASANTTTRFTALPTGFLKMRTMRLVTTPPTRLKYCTPDDLTEKLNSASGQPVWYTTHEEIEFDRTPDDSYGIDMIYYKKINTLSASVQTNDVLDDCPDLYLYGSLAEAEPYLHNDERVELWRQFYERGLEDANMAHIMDQRGGSNTEVVRGSTP